MTSKPGRLARSGAANYWAALGELAAPFSALSSAPRPVIHIPTPGRGVAGRGGPDWLGKPGAKLSCGFTRPVPSLFILTHSPLISSLPSRLRGVCGCLSVKRE